MNPLIQSKNTTILPVLIALTLGCFAVSPTAQAVCQDGCLILGNTVLGDDALLLNTGEVNTAIGADALHGNTTGSGNTAIGANALLSNTTGDRNIALGNSAGLNLTTGSNNIDIGSAGVAAEANTIRIGKTRVLQEQPPRYFQDRTFIAGIHGVTTANNAIPVVIDSAGQLGTSVLLGGSKERSSRWTKPAKPFSRSSP